MNVNEKKNDFNTTTTPAATITTTLASSSSSIATLNKAIENDSKIKTPLFVEMQSTFPFRCVPWTNWEEWLYVRKNLYSNDQSCRVGALRRVNAWRAMSTKLPQAIEATTQIVEANLHDLGVDPSPGEVYRSDMELRLMYSAIVIRTVNGLVDTGQKKHYALSISELGLQIGIPLWIIDTRHEISHNKLPSLEVLRLAVDQLNQWMNENYWQKQETYLTNISLWLNDQIENYKIAQNDEKNLLSPMTSDLVESVSRMCSITIRDRLIPALIQGNSAFLVPDSLEEKKNTTTTTTNNKKNQETTEESIALLRKTYLPLLLHCQERWSEFSSSLLFQLGQRIVLENLDSHVEYYSFSWFQYLISRDWNSFWDGNLSERIGKKNLRDAEIWDEEDKQWMKEILSRETLKELGYPIDQLLQLSRLHGNKTLESLFVCSNSPNPILQGTVATSSETVDNLMTSIVGKWEKCHHELPLGGIGNCPLTGGIPLDMELPLEYDVVESFSESSNSPCTVKMKAILELDRLYEQTIFAKSFFEEESQVKENPSQEFNNPQVIQSNIEIW